MFKKIKRYFDNLPERITDEKVRRQLVSVSSFSVCALLGIGMTIVNVFTDVGFLTYVTGGFAAACFLDILIAQFGDKGLTIARLMFVCEIITMFTFFILTGNPSGFSVIWTSLLPPMALLFYGRKKGSVASLVQFVILIFFLWCPFGKGLLWQEAADNYSTVFCLRFPFLYLGCYALAYIMVLVLELAFSKAKQNRNLYHYMMIHDSLSGVLNRSGFYELLNDLKKEKSPHPFCVGLLDLDHFKEINDTFGHRAGDVAIKQITELIGETLPVQICRWGGDEFVILYEKGSVSEGDFNKFIKRVQEFSFGGMTGASISMTVSIGVYQAKDRDTTQLDEWIKKADLALYRAKDNGRNCVEFYE